VAGDRLPYANRFSASLSLDQEFPLASRWKGFFGGSVSYIGDRESEFSTSPTQPRLVIPSYAELSARAGVRSDSWKATLFVNNLGNKQGVLGYPAIESVSQTIYGAYGVDYIQPRTVGLSLARTF